ncbi:helix-turn-helix transcriptional regulator [Pseudoalteromonas piscicida]|uniref:XRE family transcriptional regulator n=1 Tax=Pseudoalteromonas piscicida TaxID=43662 RepID=A0AAD0W443_PSEO7|nr:helix-turn-helix transcriptional regulator [Pseudoalteromonas piscicida]ASD67128.1 transcriptional regulator [Pseudoalteromonas piscicida]AXQ98120.1 XRE family transcriptional regulator [Pseudoalteromonas piscicida]AXR02166.1 XRE family transcriptional regulator [Pseudoalteromonas piscicida]
MEMKLDKAKLKQLRESKAWSQSHLAEVSGISLRTIQRIEKSGVASPESVKSICATFGIQIGDLSVGEEHQKEIVPSFSGLMRYKISNMDKKATLISFSIAFVIAFILTM